MGDDDNYDIQYFAARNQDRDRPALWFYERIVRRWVKPPGRILDFGCGTGFFLRRLLKYYDVAGYDISLSAREATLLAVPDITIYSELDQIPEAYFSGIVSLHVLEHIDRAILHDVLACWHRSLVEKGRVICAFPEAGGRGHMMSGEDWVGFGDPSHVTLLGWAEWSNLFRSAGFSVCRVGTDGLWNLPYRKGSGKLRDGLKYSIPTVLQYLLGRLILPAGSGESAVFVLEKI